MFFTSKKFTVISCTMSDALSTAVVPGFFVYLPNKSEAVSTAVEAAWKCSELLTTAPLVAWSWSDLLSTAVVAAWSWSDLLSTAVISAGSSSDLLIIAVLPSEAPVTCWVKLMKQIWSYNDLLSTADVPAWSSNYLLSSSSIWRSEILLWICGDID